MDFEEKPSLRFQVNAGIYVLNPSIINFIFENEYMDMPDLLKTSRDSGKSVNVFPIHEYWLDIGRHDTLLQAGQEWISYNITE